MPYIESMYVRHVDAMNLVNPHFGETDHKTMSIDDSISRSHAASGVSPMESLSFILYF